MKKKLSLVGIGIIASVVLGYTVVNAADYKDPGNLSGLTNDPINEMAIRTEAIATYQKLTGKNPVLVESWGFGGTTPIAYWCAIITSDDGYVLLYSTESKGSFEIIQSPKQPVVRTFSGLTTVKTMVTTISDLTTAKSKLSAFTNNK